MFVFPQSKKLLIFLLILSFSIFFKGCEASSTVPKGIPYQVGFPVKFFDLVIDVPQKIIIQNLSFTALSTNILATLLLVFLSVIIYKRLKHTRLGTTLITFGNLFIIHTLVHNISLLADFLIRLSKDNIILSIISFPAIITSTLYVILPLRSWELLFGEMSNRNIELLTRFSFSVTGFLFSLVGTILFQMLSAPSNSSRNIVEREGVRKFLFGYLPYYFLAGGIISSLLYLLLIITK